MLPVILKISETNTLRTRYPNVGNRIELKGAWTLVYFVTLAYQHFKGCARCTMDVVSGREIGLSTEKSEHIVNVLGLLKRYAA
jgi:hypothetical protein